MSIFSIVTNLLFGQSKETNKDLYVIELNSFNNYYSTHLNKVQKINSISIDISEEQTIDKDYSNLESWEVERKLFTPYKKGKITNEEILKILTSTNEGTAQVFCDLASKENINQLNSNKYYIEKLSNIFNLKGRSSDEILYFKVVQNYPDIDKEIEKIVYDLSSNVDNNINFGFLLSRYYKKENELSSLNLLEKVINSLPENSKIGTNYDENSHIFSKLLHSNNKEISKKTEDLIVKYLENCKFAPTYYIHFVLKKMEGDSFKNYLKKRFDEINTNTNEKEITYFRENLLPHYSRIFGFSSFAYIEKEIKLITQDLEYASDEKFKFKEYPSEVKFRDYLHALLALVKNNNLGTNEKLVISDFLNSIKLNNISNYYWRDYVEIIQNLYTDAKFSDYQNKFRKPQLGEIEKYWNRTVYSAKNIDHYLNKLEKIGIYQHKITEQQRTNFVTNNLYDNREVIIWNLLELLNIAYNYDAESGFYPPLYEEILPKYLEICSKELPNYTFKVQKIKTEQNQLNIILYLHNETSIFKIETENHGDWFDVNAINALFNKALEMNDKKQRFINIFTDDQTVLPIYCQPVQAELFSRDFGLKLEHKLNFN